jgi:hypothetical protein
LDFAFAGSGEVLCILYTRTRGEVQ